MTNATNSLITSGVCAPPHLSTARTAERRPDTVPLILLGTTLQSNPCLHTADREAISRTRECEMSERPSTPVGINTEFDLDKYRAQLWKMGDAELVMQGEMLARLCSPAQNFGKPPKEQWAKQLSECREEWRKRHPKVEKT